MIGIFKKNLTIAIALINSSWTKENVLVNRKALSEINFQWLKKRKLISFLLKKLTLSYAIFFYFLKIK